MSDNSNNTVKAGSMEVFRDDNHRVEKPEAIIRRVVEKKYPKLSYEQTSHVISDLISKPADAKLKVGDEEIRVDSLTEYVADMMEKMNASESDGGDSSMSEYYQWIESGQEILSHMNDGFVSHEDLNERNELLSDFEQREVDLMTCISLYRRCNLQDPRIRQKYELMNRKLVKLREIRSAIKTSTKDKADEKQSSSAEKARDGALAMVYAGVLTKLGAEALKDSPQISDEQKRALNVYYEPHVNDKYIMASIQADLQNQGRFQESLAEELLQHRAAMKEQNLQSVQMRLAQLSGRVQMPSQEQKKPVNVQNRTFDMNRYMMLKQKQEQLGAYELPSC